jgi:hypothetical protein
MIKIIRRIINWWNKYWEDFEKDFNKMTPEQQVQFWDNLRGQKFL